MLKGGLTAFEAFFVWRPFCLKLSNQHLFQAWSLTMKPQAIVAQYPTFRYVQGPGVAAKQGQQSGASQLSCLLSQRPMKMVLSPSLVCHVAALFCRKPEHLQCSQAMLGLCWRLTRGSGDTTMCRACSSGLVRNVRRMVVVAPLQDL